MAARADDRRPACGALVGLFVAPYAQAFFEVELDAVESALERLAPQQIVGGVGGLIAGLIVAFLVKNVLFEAIASARTGRHDRRDGVVYRS